MNESSFFIEIILQNIRFNDRILPVYENENKPQQNRAPRC